MPHTFLGAGNLTINNPNPVPSPGAPVSHARIEWENRSFSSLSPANVLKTEDIVCFIKQDRPAGSLGFLGEKSLWS